MPLIALALVIIAAFTHASWNLLAKQAAGCRHFIWFYSVGATAIFLPIVTAIIVVDQPHFGTPQIACLLGSCVLHLLYSESLQRGYRAADLSVVYPVARGSGPLLSFTGAVVLLHEQASWTALGGALLVVTGVLTLAGNPRRMRANGAGRGVIWGLVTGACIASYTLTDGYAVKVLALSPILVDYVGNLFRACLLGPKAWRDRTQLASEYRQYWRAALGVSILGPAGYMLILTAMRFAPVSHVAPARELSMMVGALYGAQVLREGQLARRLFASLLIVSGVLALAFG